MQLPSRLQRLASPASARRFVEDPTRRFFALVAAADLAFFAIHLAYSPDGLLNEPRFRPDWDRGYAETFQYLKEFWIILLFGLAVLRHSAAVYAVLVALFTYLALDDLLRLHERIGGGVLGVRLPDLPLLGATLTGYDLGQVTYAGCIGLSALLIIGLFYRRADTPVQKTVRVFVYLLVLLASFGILGDVVTALTEASSLNAYVSLVEEGASIW